MFNNVLVTLGMAVPFFGSGIIRDPIIETELQPYFNEFNDQVKETCKDNYKLPRGLVIGFSIIAPPVVGYCIKTPIEWLVAIDRLNWVLSDESERYALMMHELTHCYFRTGHTSDPDHYMYSETRPIKPEVVKKQYQKIIREECEK
jgi:hypothetical protein